MHRDGKSLQKTNQSKSLKEFNDKIEKEQVKLSEDLTKINEKSNQKFQDDLKQLTERLTSSFLKEINRMQQEMQYLKNKVKNLFEENMKLRPLTGGITHEMKSRNNHTAIAYNETNEIKKSLEILTKIHLEYSETSNKDIINIKNNIRNIADLSNK